MFVRVDQLFSCVSTRELIALRTIRGLRGTRRSLWKIDKEIPWSSMARGLLVGQTAHVSGQTFIYSVSTKARNLLTIAIFCLLSQHGRL